MLEKAYDPQTTEDRIYAMWEDSGAFIADAGSAQKPFTISMPPPNATGQLHLGHAVMLALEDIFIRFERMRGREVLWVPGTDHAAIATENVVIRQLRDQGMRDPRAELGREKLVSEIAAFVEESKSTIRSQIRKMGSSCDWTRERYTLDPSLSRCVNEVFVKMYRDGLIYRGHRIVNWDPKLQTTVSDDEITYTEEKSSFYTFRYGPFEIGTARPETKFGDKYVVMHPDDVRYAQYKHGETFECEWINESVRATIIKDTSVDPAFGTGVMTITPWHDHTDFEIAERHGLEKEQIIGFDGKLLSISGEFAGMSIEKARPLIVEKLAAKGLLIKTEENYIHNKARSQRGGGAIEPQIKLQWFIDVNKKIVQWKGALMSLKEVMHAVIHQGDISIVPDRFVKTYFHWIDNLRDWCISRQIWWGHRVPVYYCSQCVKIPNIIASVFSLDCCPDCGNALEQDSDTLDTWFSSALWTWSTLVDPEIAKDMNLSLEEILESSPDFRKFHPTSVIETGYDIIFFWVARMILMTTYAIGQIPFKTVYLHGMIRTRDGAKMSKSDPETMIDPLVMIEKYGADALRMSMIVGQSPGNDQKLYEEKIEGYRNFVNKLWNAARFVMMECEKSGVSSADISSNRIFEYSSNRGSLLLADRALLSELQILISDVTEGLESYRLSEVGERLYSFVWDFFCDWYLEWMKVPRVQESTSGNSGASESGESIEIAVHAMRTILTLLHPYCPYVTEELWNSFKPEDAGMLIRQEWPESNSDLIDARASDDFQVITDVIKAIRSIRSEYGVDAGKFVDVIIHTDKHLEPIRSERTVIQRIARVGDWTLDAVPVKHEHSASVFLKDIEVHVPLTGIIDLTKERERLAKEMERLEKFLMGVRSKLGNPKFMENANPDVIAAERRKEDEAGEKLGKIIEKINNLRGGKSL